MGYQKKIVCLANSRKPPSGRCVAGREVLAGGFGGWIRPVSARSTREISEEERRYEDGTDPMVLDVIAIEMSNPQQDGHQRENHLIDDSYYWVKRGTVSWAEIQGAIEIPEGPLWINGYSSSHGFNDQVPEDYLGHAKRSLFLVRPETLSLAVAVEGGGLAPRRRRVRAEFRLGGQRYCIVVTDPRIERQYLAGVDGERIIEDALLCVSLGGSFHGYAYKLAAAVITPERAGRY